MSLLKKIIKPLFKIIILALALYGAYYCYMQWQYHSVKAEVEKREATRSYDKDLKYLMPSGKPIFMVNPANKSTLFFIEGFRGQIGAGHYQQWFDQLYNKHHINIISPIIGLQGWPYAYRTRDWHYEEDMRQVVQIYDAFCANLAPGHRVVIGSMSFGALSNITIGAKAKRAPDAMVLVSPLNTGIEYKSGSAITRWLATQMSWIQYVKPVVIRGKNPARASSWDIVNDEMNIRVWNNIAKDIINWEENLPQGMEVNRAADYMEKTLVPQVKKNNIIVMYGDSDLTFSQKGFLSLAEKLKTAGNKVQPVMFEKSGHMLLHDNGGDRAKMIFLDVLLNRHSFN